MKKNAAKVVAKKLNARKSKTGQDDSQTPGPRTQQLWREAVEARKKSYSPYSNFAVGAAFAVGTRALGSGGAEKDLELSTGTNVENASYGGTVCAERVAILKAVSEGRRYFAELVVVGELTPQSGPCALCLQTMAEFCHPQMPIWIATPQKILRRFSLAELLPLPFGPAQLGAAKSFRARKKPTV